jgi:hypothetical protein
MNAVAGFVALAGSMLLAAVRLVTRYDKQHGSSYLVVTPASRLYVLLHGLAALVPFPIFEYWGKKWAFLGPFPPLFLAAVAVLFINQMLKLEGLDLPEATGRLSKLRAAVHGYVNQHLANEEHALMRTFLAPYTRNRELDEVRALELLNIPMQLREDRKKACRKAISNAQTIEDAMELYIRHVGMESFLCMFTPTPPDKQLLLFEVKPSRRDTQPQLRDRVAAFGTTLH